MLAFYRLNRHAALDSELAPPPVAQVSVDRAAVGALPVVDFSAPLLLAMPWATGRCARLHRAVAAGKTVDLLPIRHHRELSFAFARLWLGSLLPIDPAL